MISRSALTVSVPRIQCSERVTDLKNRIRQAALRARFERVEVHAFGSSVNGFGDETSDIDLVLDVPEEILEQIVPWNYVRDLIPATLDYLSDYLVQEGFQVREKVLSAKVPILKLTIDGVECDLSCNNLLPVFNTKLLSLYAEKDHRVVEMARRVKTWAKKEGVHGATNGHLSSYTFGLMVIFYMQQKGGLPCLQTNAENHPQWYGERNGRKAWNVFIDETPTAETELKHHRDAANLRGFAQFLTDEKDFIWGRDVISVRQGKVLPLDSRCFRELNRRLRDWDDNLLHIEDPFDIARNLCCVFSPGSNRRLWNALKRLAEDPGAATPVSYPTAHFQSEPSRVAGNSISYPAPSTVPSAVPSAAPSIKGTGQAAAPRDYFLTHGDDPAATARTSAPKQRMASGTTKDGFAPESVNQGRIENVNQGTFRTASMWLDEGLKQKKEEEGTGGRPVAVERQSEEVREPGESEKRIHCPACQRIFCKGPRPCESCLRLSMARPLLPILRRGAPAERVFSRETAAQPEAMAAVAGGAPGPSLMLPLRKRSVNFAEGAPTAAPACSPRVVGSSSAAESQSSQPFIALTIAPSPTDSASKPCTTTAASILETPTAPYVALSVEPSPTAFESPESNWPEDIASGFWKSPSYVAIQVGGSPRCAPQGLQEYRSASPTTAGTASGRDSPREESFWKCLLGTSPSRIRWGVMSRLSTSQSSPTTTPVKASLLRALPGLLENLRDAGCG
eukprot:s842_g15.t1